MPRGRILVALVTLIVGVSAQTVTYQVNQPEASLTIDGLPGNINAPIAPDLFPNTGHTLTISGTVGQAFQIYTTEAATISMGSTLGLQFLNLDMTHPSFRGLYGSPLPVMGSQVTIPFTLTAPVPMTGMQMAVTDPTAYEGFRVSAPLEVISPPVGIYVDGDYGGGNGNGTINQPFTTISQAVAGAALLDRIFVDPATNGYVENVVITTSLVEIIGTTWNQPTAARPVITPLPGPGTGYTVQVMDNVAFATIRGFEIHLGTYDGNHGPGPTTGACVAVWNGAYNALVSDCVFTGTNPFVSGDSSGIRVMNGASAEIQNCRFQYLDHVEPGAPKNVAGVRVIGGGANVRNCEFANLGELHALNDGNVVIRGVECSGGTGLAVVNCLFRDITVPASDLGAGPDPTVTVADCAAVFTQNTGSIGVYNTTIVGWDLSNAQGGATAHGLRLGSSSTPLLTSNILSDVVLPASGSTGTAIELPGGVTSVQMLASYNCVDNSWTTRFVPAFFEDVPTSLTVPGYNNPAVSDYTLGPGSPCIDSGIPTQPDPDGSPNDRGAYGGPGSYRPIGTL